MLICGDSFALTAPCSLSVASVAQRAWLKTARGPAGRRPRLLGTGLEVWEAIWVVRDNDGDEREAAEYLQMPLGLVQAAVAYYGAYRDEIEVIELNARESEAAHQAWLAGREALKR
jgi:uncharacterized protein (DUF433 family)